MKNLTALLGATLLMAGCAPAIELTESGPVEVGSLQFDTPQSLNRIPPTMVGFARPGTGIWTNDGLQLDRLIVIPAVPDGEPLFREPNKAMALPRFRADMLPNEIVQFTESSLVKLFGEGEAIVTTSNLRPARFGRERGVMFDLRVEPSEGPALSGLAGAFVAESQLNMLLFTGAEPHYHAKHRPSAEMIIASARRKE